MKTGIVSDHGGFALKEYLKKNISEMEWIDYGCYSEESVDYPDMAKILAESILGGKVSRGIAICGTGIGISIALNRYKQIRAALCHNLFTAEMSRKHNDANILSLGGRILSNEEALAIVNTFFKTSFEGGRHKTRIEKLEALG